MSVTSGRAASQPFTQRRDFWVLMGYAVALGVFGAFTGLVFIGVIKAGGKWYADSHPGPVSTQAAPHRGSGTGMEISERPENRRGTCLACGWRSAQWFVRNPRRGRPAAHGHPNRQICAQAMAHSTALTAIHTRQGECGWISQRTASESAHSLLSRAMASMSTVAGQILMAVHSQGMLTAGIGRLRRLRCRCS